MFLADLWRDYELLDTSDGERLERWGKYILVRPDPQIIWKDKKEHPLWEKPDARYKRNGGGGGWVLKNIPDCWNISYKDMKFEISPMGFKHTGLFPEQAANWDWFSDLILRAQRPVKVLNLFAYTGGATVAAAKAGASVCHVDASKGMVERAKHNAKLSGLEDAPIRYIVDDCKKFLEREIRRGNKYDAVIMDPPSYGRGPRGEVWKLEDQICELIDLSLQVLSDEPLFFLLNSYTTGLSASAMAYLVDITIGKKYGGKSDAQDLALPVSASGGALPCGSSVRWTK
ncbi:MAG: class I SAM-dependent methyltransferase [Clostridia bacterium]|nr:class I SAM-dependent methyltransferase [Clostridia bacterium]